MNNIRYKNIIVIIGIFTASVLIYFSFYILGDSLGSKDVNPLFMREIG